MLLTAAKNTRGKAEQNYFEVVVNVTDILIFLMYYIFFPKEEESSMARREETPRGIQ
jgi:hypothetical protein